MSQSAETVLCDTDGSMLELAQALAGTLLIRGQVDSARNLLRTLLDRIALQLPAPREPGVNAAAPVTMVSSPGAIEGFDIVGALWLVHAGYLYQNYEATGSFWRESMLPLLKRMAQAIISGHYSNLRMDDGGLLNQVAGNTESGVEGKPKGEGQLLLNILWDNTLAILAEELKLAGDSAGDHFERLRGRFKRSFLKAFWSDEAGYLLSVPLGLVEGVNPGNPSGVGGAANAGPVVPMIPVQPIPVGPADPNQILHAVLAVSALPRTKQRLVVDLLAKNCLSPYGMQILPEAGVSTGRYSPLLLAWLTEAHVRTNDAPATAVAEAINWLKPLAERLEQTGGLAQYYDAEGQVLGDGAKHLPSMAEVRRVWWGLCEAADKPLGNSKRTRLSGLLLPTPRLD